MLLLFVIIVTLQACNNDNDTKGNTPDKKNRPKSIALIADSVGFGDKSINDSAKLGLTSISNDSGIKTEVSESSSEDAYKNSIESALKDRPTLLWTVGHGMQEATYQAAVANKDTQFVLLDTILDDNNLPTNILATSFKNQEPSYLAGYLAASFTKSKKVGFLGGAKGSIQDEYEYGFKSGVRDAEKERKAKIEVIVKYADTFTDEGKGYILSKSMYENKVDVIYNPCGLTGLGAIQAAKDLGKFVIGADKAQMEIAPLNMISAVDKKYNLIVADISKKHINGEKLESGNYEYGLASKAIALYKNQEDENSLFTDKLYKAVNEKAKEIVDGKVVPAYDEASFKKSNK